MDILTNLNLNKNELQNAVVQPLAGAPANPALGQIYYNSVDKIVYIYDGYNWAPMGAASVASVNGKTGVVVLTMDDIGNGATYVRTHNDLTDALVEQIGANAEDIVILKGLIPAAASAQNQLADKAYVNSSIQTSSAHFRGNWPEWDDVPTDSTLYPADDDGVTTPTSNDYMVVQDASGYPVADGESALVGTWRFKYSGVWATNGKAGWLPEYQVNETPLTAAQLAALNSGITAALVAIISANQTAITGIKNGTTINDFAAVEAALAGVTVKTASGVIGTSATSASVAYSGTLLAAYATMGGSKVLTEISVGETAVTFQVAAAPTAAVTCTVVYV